MDYDVLVLGGGIIGCAVAYELSKYSLNIALIEKDYDIASDVALTNTAIVYDGVECDNTFMAKLEFMGNSMFSQITEKFNIPFKKCGSLVTASGSKGEERLNHLFKQAQDRGIEYVKLLSGEEARRMEPSLSKKVTKALYSPNTGVTCPYDLAIAYGEIAFDNGVNFRLTEEVLDIEDITKGVRVTTNKNKFTCKMVINTTPGEHYSIDLDRNISYHEKEYMNHFLLEKQEDLYSRIVLSIGEDGKNGYYVNTLKEYDLVSVRSEEKLSLKNTVEEAKRLFDSIDEKRIDSFYSVGYKEDDIVIDDSYLSDGYIRIIGKHYGHVTMTPYIAKMVCETVVSNLNAKPKKDFKDRRRETYNFKKLSNEERQKLIDMDKRYGSVICHCNMVTEGEIVDCIRRPLGARTLEGVQRRTGATFGRCKGAYCLNKVVSILARETNQQVTDIVKNSKKSKILLNRIKEFDSV
ncbi:MAG: FAD-dependent oxidoreductase [Clostridiales bacterium]|uniref:NAD(P)/FAD-dependent oxidoreductase n=1 Tax=Clostridium sp. N3C TaxID=1776758 RepID=UPI00092DEB80|nr:FAD-dependent oxidoreductase [Clostridium sp. N3C]NLZ47485.1 FAD-dependent oxidoreductase [Clostridiales bacterium]SCN26307.1 hydroxyglutarate oxidase [Clostridium sp. N3C]